MHIRIAAATALVGLALTSTTLLAGPGGTVNGVAVSVHYHWGNIDAAPYGSNGCYSYAGSLQKFTITNGSVTNTQTLIDGATSGWVQYPVMDINGTTVAFWRISTSMNAPAHVSVISINGGAITDLVTLPSNVITGTMALNLQNIGGELWVYYIVPFAGDWVCSWGRPFHEIRRVRVSDKRDELVQHLADAAAGSDYDIADGSIAGGQIIRFEMNAKGDRAAVKGCQSGNTNTVYPFPMLGSEACPGNGVGGVGSCNIGCSVSGFYATGYGGGWHTDLLTSKCSGAPALPALRNVDSYGTGHFYLADAAAIAGTATPAGAEWPLWSCNSDKWVCQQVGWKAHAGDLRYGSNQLLENWAESKAIMTSTNPKLNWSTNDQSFQCNCSGDFWVDNTAHVGCYEAADGSWVPVQGATADPALRVSPDTLKFTASVGGSNPAAQNATISNDGAGTLNTVTTATVYAQGSGWLGVVRSGSDNSQTLANTVTVGSLAANSYYATVTVTCANSTPTTRMYVVKFTVQATPVLTTISVTPASASILPSATAQFSASARDQFGAALSSQPTFSWSVTSGAGSIGTSGLFTSNGSIGTFTVTASASNVNGTAQVAVSTGCPMPNTGFVKEMLVLQNASNSMMLPSGDDAGIQILYAGMGKTVPVAGQQVTVNSNTYTWALLSDADGLWLNQAGSNFVAFGYLTVISSSTQTVKMSVEHDNGFNVWNNGTKVVDFGDNTWSSWQEQLSGTFNLASGDNGMFIRMHDGGADTYFGFRIVDDAGTNVTGLTYRPCGATGVADRSVPTTSAVPCVRATGLLTVYDCLGRVVTRAPASVTRTGQSGWNGLDNAGNRVPRGTYFCRLDAAGSTISRVTVR